MYKIFIVKKNPEGDDWQIANFGEDNQGNKYWLCINSALIDCKRVRDYAPGAKQDAKLVARLLNKYYKKLINERTQMSDGKITLPRREVQRVSKYYHVVEMTVKGWVIVSKAYAHSTSAYAKLGRLTQQDTLKVS